ncbi:hypothetical protein CLOM_g6630 [Closterium sp. NIES-68]|nr:hypothetical protein CLOM_g6630 [Closterium sp. NIES-68]
MACLHFQPSLLAPAAAAVAALQSHSRQNSLPLVARLGCRSSIREGLAEVSAAKLPRPKLSSRRQFRVASGAVCVRAQGPTTAAAAAAADAAGAPEFSELASIAQSAPPEAEKKQPISDLVWPAVGAFVSFAGFALADHLLQSHGLTVSLGSFGAVCCLLFALPQAPVSQRKTILIAHAGTALIGVALFCLLGPSWLAKATAVAASIAFMQFTNSVHPPAAGLPLIFLDAPKFHRLKWWYPLFPGLVGCLWLFLVQEVILLLKDNVKF